MSRCILFLLSGLTALLQVLGDGSCTVVLKEEEWLDYVVSQLTTSRPRKYWCQVSCPIDSSLSDGHEICPYFAPSATLSSCNDSNFSWTPPSSCNQGFSGAGCPPALAPGSGSACNECAQSQMQCSTCGASELCSTTNGFSVTHNGVSNSHGGCDYSLGELTSCEGRNSAACGYLCTGRCERGFFSSWDCNLEGQQHVISRCERTTVDDPNTPCDFSSCANGCMSAFLTRVAANEVNGWELSYPLGNATNSTLPCFPSDATVRLASGAAVLIDTLNVGDRILAARADGSLAHDSVSSFSLAQRRVGAHFMQLHLGGAHSVRMTPTHHLPVGAYCCTHLKQAKDVLVGDLVWVAEGGTLVPRTVLQRSHAFGHGLHNPLMRRGGFPVIDGLVTSFNSAPAVARNALIVPLVETLCPSLARLVVAATNAKTMHYIDGAIVEPLTAPSAAALAALATLALAAAAGAAARHLSAAKGRKAKSRKA